MSETLAEQFFDLFQGLDRAHGRYDLSGAVQEGSKNKGRATTAREPLTVALWEDHLAGRTGLGVVPIRDDGTVRWGAIDVDKYTLDLPELSKKLANTAFLVARSKSGGAHVYCFTGESVPAQLMIERLAQAAAALGYGGSEIFPKQAELRTDRDDVGNWLNMPYFGGDESTRYVLINGESVDTATFIDAARARRLSVEDLRTQPLVESSEDEEAIPDGPPCLQLLCKNGIGAGMRNNALYNIGVYLKMAYPDDWKTRLEDYNRRFVNPPLEASEVVALYKSLEKKTYHYTCDREPLASHCDKRRCVKRKFGVRGGDGGNEEANMPMIGGLTKLELIPPIWFLDVDGHRVGPMQTEDLQQQSRFQKVCMEQVNKMPPMIKPNRWNELMNHLLATAQIVDMPDDSGDAAQVWYHLEKFCTGRAQCTELDELLASDKPWTDDVNGLTYFKLVDFITYLERRRFKNVTPQQLAAFIRDRGALADRKKIKGKDVSLWIVPRFEQSTVELQSPTFDDNTF